MGMGVFPIKLYSSTLKSEFQVSFTCHKIFLFFRNHLKVFKKFLTGRLNNNKKTHKAMGQIWLEGCSLQTPNIKDKLSEARNLMPVTWSLIYFYFGMSHAHRRGSFNTICLKAPLRHPIIPNHKWRQRTFHLERTGSYSGSQIFREHYDLCMPAFKFSWSPVVSSCVMFSICNYLHL